MKSKIKYTDEPLGKLKVIPDFLPSPKELAAQDRKVRITLNLTEASLAFFKKLGRENRTPYQKVIRGLLDYYASHAA